jgi:acyl carrier protein phosphodiesterase
MNWLAHILLSEPTPEFRIGNILPDLLSANELRGIPATFAPGVACHRIIDAFTDRHPAVRRSIERLSRSHRRFGGIIVDMLYDHLLAVNWSLYSGVPFDDFVNDVYDSFEKRSSELPEIATTVLERMSMENWLGSYRTVEGVRDALNRIGARLRNPVRLGECIPELKAAQKDFHSDFAEFFPELVAHVRAAG